MTNVLLLGGYGATGRLLAELLLQDPRMHVTLAGRRQARAERLAELLSERHPDRVEAIGADASRAESLVPALQGMDLLVVASSTAVHTQTVARAALRAGADCYDILYSPAKLSMLRAMEPELRRAGRCFITDGGFHPGMPAVLVRRAAQHFGELHTAVVGSIIQQDWRAVESSPETVDEVLEVLAEFDPSLFVEGEWRRRPRLAEAVTRRRVDFGEPLGARACYAMKLEELLPLPSQFPTLRSVGCFVGGFNPVVDWGVMPLVLLGRRLAPQRSRAWLGRLLAAGLRRGSRPPFRTVLKLEATGRHEGAVGRFDLETSHADGYYLTAACAAACINQLVDGSIRRPGVWLQGQAVEPQRMLADLSALGVEVSEGWHDTRAAGTP